MLVAIDQYFIYNLDHELEKASSKALQQWWRWERGIPGHKPNAILII